MARYPGSPYDAGDIHPILLDPDNALTIAVNSDKIVMGTDYVIDVYRDSLTEKGPSMAEAPATDRLLDLALLGWLVEHGVLPLRHG